MKKISLLLILTITISVFATGCFKRDTLEDIEIMTTVYPIEYITNRLYGNHSVVNSIYPDDTNPSRYTLSEKQLSDYSKKELFIYNAISNDKNIATGFLNRNKNMLIIDSAFGMEITNGIEELWLNPSHLLMMTQNIRNGLKEYITNNYLKKEIDKNYESLNVELSELDADIKLTAENAKNKTIIVNNDILKYLEKYGFKVISLDETHGVPSDRVVNDVINMINNKELSYIFMLEYDDQNATVKNVIEKTKAETKLFRRIDNITDQERDNKETYLTIMNKNIEQLKEELYK
ncbi:MAG: metal ABC transporter substrate-binding protein [Bacilli bacterium]